MSATMLNLTVRSALQSMANAIKFHWKLIVLIHVATATNVQVSAIPPLTMQVFTKCEECNCIVIFGLIWTIQQLYHKGRGGGGGGGGDWERVKMFVTRSL